jgi:hypothetical protein
MVGGLLLIRLARLSEHRYKFIVLADALIAIHLAGV